MFRRLSVAVMATVALAACHDTNPVAANLLVFPDTLVAYALSGTPAAYPSGLSTVARTTVLVNGAAGFDVAFDMDRVTGQVTGQVTVLPVRLLVDSLIGAPSVGLQLVSTTPFDSLTRAPGGYYRPDTALTVTPRETFVILANRNGGSVVCYYVTTPQIYAKVVIDSVNTTTGAIYLRMVVNPNCGYRSFLFGIPTG